MATTTPNFGWSVPTSTDLVKNGATAIETLGDSIDASMADLKGGTTGQVLAKATGTDMDFTWTTPSGGTNSFYAGKNKIINGDFGIWQRGTSFNPSGVGFFLFADRFRSYTYSASATTASQQAFTVGTAPVAGYEGTFFGRVVSTNTFAYFSYNGIENVRTFAGQTVTLSYWAKSASAQTLNEVQVTQYFGSTGSTAVATTLTAPSITTSWARYTHTFTMPSISGKTIGGGNDGIFINIKGAINNALDMWGFQLEAGSTATDFVTASGGSPQAELAMCQRYYYRQNAQTAYTHFASGGFASTTTAFKFVVAVPVEMRVVPTSVDFNALAAWDGGATYSLSSIGFEYTNKQQIGLAGTSSGMTANRASLVLSQNNTAAYLGFSAELQEIIMDNVTFFEIETLNGIQTHALIAHADGSFTSMLKSTYDELKANEAQTI